jgi:hypothetical protein
MIERVEVGGKDHQERKPCRLKYGVGLQDSMKGQGPYGTAPSGASMGRLW